MKPVITSIRDCKSGFFGHASFLKQELGAVKWHQDERKTRHRPHFFHFYHSRPSLCPREYASTKFCSFFVTSYLWFLKAVLRETDSSVSFTEG